MNLIVEDLLFNNLFFVFFVFFIKVWLTLADQYLRSISIDWEKTMRFAFNDRSNPDDDSLGIQIVKVWIIYEGFICKNRYQFLEIVTFYLLCTPEISFKLVWVLF